MITTFHVTFGSLMVGMLLMVMPIYALYMLKVDVWRSASRALGQTVVGVSAAGLLVLAGVKVNHCLFTLLCALGLMGVTATYMVLKARLRQMVYVLPVMGGMVVVVLPLALLFLYGVLGVERPFDAQCLLPIVGLMVGGVAEANVKALRTYHDGLRHHANFYYYLVANGASHEAARRHFVHRALKRSVLPLLQRMGLMSLGSAPVTMWVMVLCGIDVGTAIVVQILLSGLLVSAAVGSLSLALLLARRCSFDAYNHIHTKS